MKQLPSILLAEDEDNDILLLTLALKKAGIPNPLVVVKDGRELVDYLLGPALVSEEAPTPGLLILDLKMPELDGFEVLRWLAEQPHYRSLPVVVLTSSGLESDMRLALQLGARGFYIKPQEPHALVQLLKRLQARWLMPQPEPTASSEA